MAKPTDHPTKTKTPSYNFNDLKDFPELKSSSGYQERNMYFNNIKQHSEKSWLSVVDTKTGKQIRVESFPSLPSTKSFKHRFDEQVKSSDVIGSKTMGEKVSSQENGNKQKEVVEVSKENINNFKKFSNPTQKQFKKKKKNHPVYIDLSEIIEKNKMKKQLTRHKIAKNKFHRHVEKEILSGNFLDASNPKRSKGKHREIKKKKLSSLKFSIIKERILKQKIREQALTAFFSKDCINLVEKLDFKVEVKKYLKESDKKKEEMKAKKNVLKKDTSTDDESKPKEKQTDEVKAEVKLENINHTIKSSPSEENKSSISEKGVRFSAKLREYCDNIVTPSLNTAISELITGVVALQDKLFARDPIKAKAKKRHVSGLREVEKYLNLSKAKLIIIAPNLEKLQNEGSIFDIINRIKENANRQNVPYVFALNRNKLGRCTKKNVPVSAYGIINYEGLENLLENALQEIKYAKEKFAEMSKPKIMSESEENQNLDVNSKLISSFISAFKEELHISKEAENSNSSLQL